MCYNFLVGDTMTKQWIVFFDIDHTIYDPYKREFPNNTIESIKQLHARQDVIIVIATGRAFYMLDFLEPLWPHIDYVITINGQIIWHKDQVIADYPMDQVAVNQVIKVFEKFNLTYGFISKHMQAINRLDDQIANAFNDVNIPLPIVDANYAQKHPIYQMWAFADKPTFEIIKNHLPNHQLVAWLSDGFDVIPTNKSKRDGVMAVLEHTGLSLEQSICFGDGDNDKEMIESIPKSIAMGNAKPHIKALAYYVTKAFDDDGISHALKKLKLIE